MNLNPWANGFATDHKFEICRSLRHCFLPLLVCSCDKSYNLCSLWSSLNLHVNWRKFVIIWWPNTSWRKLVSVSLSLVWTCMQGCTEMAFLWLASNLCVLVISFCHPLQVCVRKFTFPNLQWLVRLYVQTINFFHFIGYLEMTLTNSASWVSCNLWSGQILASLLFTLTGSLAMQEWVYQAKWKESDRRLSAVPSLKVEIYL